MNRLLRLTVFIVLVLLASLFPQQQVFADDPPPIETPTVVDPGQVDPRMTPQGAPQGDQGQADGETTPGNSPDSVDSPDATSGSVTVASVRTADLNGNTKTTFNPGDSIRYYGSVKNSTSKSVTAYFVWSRSGPCGSVTLWAGNLNTGTGTWLWNIDSSVPTNCAGAYKYTLSVTYNSKKSAKSANFSVVNTASCPTIRTWKGEYWANQNLSGAPVLCRDDPEFDYDWESGSPDYRFLPNDHFSVRWTRTMYFNAGYYRFSVSSDDGIRVWLDTTLIINQWSDGGHGASVDRNLSAGNHSFKVEYYENSGLAHAAFWWLPLSNVNLALGHPVYATSQQAIGLEPDKANDGNYGTRWSSRVGSGDEWWRVDLGTSTTFNRVVIRWEAAYASQYFVGWSNDGNNFTGSWYTLSDQRNVVLDLGSHTARYVAIMLRQHAPCCGNYSFWEFEVWNTTGVTSADLANVEADAVHITPADDVVTLQMVQGAGDNRLFLPFVQR